MHPGTIIIHPRAKKSTTHEGDRLILHLKFYSRVYPPHVWKLQMWMPCLWLWSVMIWW